MAESTGGARVLIVERDRNVRTLQQHFLEAAGFTVAFCDDGVSALESAQASPPAVVVTEILIPGLDGLTLCRQLRADVRTARIPVIVFSILAAAGRAADAGATAYLRKPLVASTFVDAVRTALPTPSPEPLESQWASK